MSQIKKKKSNFVSIKKLNNFELIKIGVAIGICLVGLYFVLKISGVI